MRPWNEMESWEHHTEKHIKTPPKIKAFIEDVIAVCKKHNMSIGHEDGHGGFEIQQYDEFYTEWLQNASLDLPPWVYEE